MVVRFIVLFKAFLLAITRSQVVERYAPSQLIGGNDPRFGWQAEQAGLLRVDDCLIAGNFGLKCTHLRCF